MSKEKKIMNKEVIFVRIDEDLKKKLDNIALDEQRSLNNLVVWVLTKFIDVYDEEHEKEEQTTEN